jgi:hypothetical protein
MPISRPIKIKMSNETTNNFLQAVSEFVWPDPQPVSYRLYYNEHGNPMVYSMEGLPGNYIEVDPQTYAVASFRVRVVDQKLIYVQPTIQVKKLQPDTAIGTPCSTVDVCVVVSEQDPHTKWKISNNETN